jgi:hypothetical protein
MYNGIFFIIFIMEIDTSPIVSVPLNTFLNNL